MKIRVKADGHNIWLALPNWMVLNGAAKSIAVQCLNKYIDAPLTAEQINGLFNELRDAHSLLGKQPLASIRTAKGEIVYIRL